jgi:translation initiation factor eIF-2B subunit delta
MGNAIRWLKVEINDVDPDTDEAQAKHELSEAIDRFILERITAADQAIMDAAASKIRDGDVIVTFGKSHIVQKTLVAAHRQGRRFSVRVIDARPLFEGRNAARELAEAGIDVQYGLTNAISHCARDASKVFLGASAMLSNGRLYARAGTALVALMAHANNVPVIVCCESVKFTDKVALDAIVTNEVAPPDELVKTHSTAGLTSPLASWRQQPHLQLLSLMYDVTPAEYISMVVTEYGSLPPSSVPVVYGLSTNT